MRQGICSRLVITQVKRDQSKPDVWYIKSIYVDVTVYDSGGLNTWFDYVFGD